MRVGGDKPWGPHNDIGLGYMSEVVSGSMHSGAHIDALAHMTLGAEARWYGGSTADQHLGDFGPTRGDGSKLPSIVTRGVLLDVAGFRGLDALTRIVGTTGSMIDPVAIVGYVACSVLTRLGGRDYAHGARVSA